MKIRSAYLYSVAILILLAIGIFAHKSYTNPTRGHMLVPGEIVEDRAESPVFTWKFEDAETRNPDGNPETRVVLEARYPDGSLKREVVDTVHSSCNELPVNESDSLSNTKDIQCYGAGLGYRFKIMRGESSYLVQRKTFEEALPDVEPVEYEYEVIAGFPLRNY